MVKLDKVLVWGTGVVAKIVIANGLNIEVMGFVQTGKTLDFFMEKPVYSAEELPEDYDYILVANTYGNEIYRLAVEKQLDLEKIIFLQGVSTAVGCTDLKIIEHILGEKNFVNYCSKFRLYNHTFFEKDKETYKKLNRRDSFGIDDKYLWPIITDKYAQAGSVNNYFWQDLWAARLIIKSGVKKHFDIGSRIDGFVAHVLAAGIEVSLIDIREFPWEVEGLHTVIDDATDLKQVPDESVESLSALCSLEHFGLGRYGDPIDPEACFRCFEQIQKKLKRGGKLYIAVPIGKERVEFNAHRVFYSSTIIEAFSSLELVEFSCTAAGKIEYNVDIHKYDEHSSNGDYRYGLFYFIKN